MFISGLLQGLKDIAILKRLYVAIGLVVLWVMALTCSFLFISEVFTIAVLVFSLTVGFLVSVLIFSVILSLKEGIGAIVKGEKTNEKERLSTGIDGGLKHEMGMLVRTFNDLSQQLEANIDEVEQLRVSFGKEQQRAAHYERAKQYFLVNMSHEIRTPMNAILGFASYLQESLKEEEDIESVKMIIKSAEHLLATLNDILDYVNIETGEVSFVCLPFNLKDTVQSIFMLNESNAKQKQIGLKYHVDGEIPEAIYGDSVRLTQILLSLTSNGIKFTEKGGVFISARMVSEHDDHVMIEFSVQDTGMGIDVNMQKTIFNPFEQGANDMKRKFGGTGIGLSIVKHLIALQDGAIQLKSRPGEGAEFYFKLPFLKVHAGKYLDQYGHNELNLVPESEIGKGTHVLIVEDNAINQLLVIKLLQKRGYQTSVAENGKIALHKYHNTDFDIILMDLQMPEMDGYETTNYIRGMAGYKSDIPIVAMTAHTIKGEREKCLSIGMNDYISKPFQADELYEKVKTLVGDTRSILLKQNMPC